MITIYTDKDKCLGCYGCVRSCVAKAIRVRESLAEIIKERCISCGTCVQVCTTGAKKVEGEIGVVWQLLGQSAPVIAILSASFPAGFPEIEPRQLVTSLKKLGFSEVMEDSFGAELVCREYASLLNRNDGVTYLSSPCPAITAYVEKYYQQLIDSLVPIVSPMIAMGRAIKWQYNPEASVVFIGSCIAKGAEATDENVANVVDAVLTFADLKEMFAAKGINPAIEEEGEFSGPKPNRGRLFAISGGLTEIAGISTGILSNDVINACGRDSAVRILRELAEGNITAKLVSLCFCEGCISGPVIDNKLSVFKRREIITSYTTKEADPEQTERDIEEYANIDLSRKFTAQAIGLASPSEEDIGAVLREIGKADRRVQTNCGACGYASCQEMAIAVCQNLAEVNMCWPYVIDKLESTQSDLIHMEKLTSLGQLAASIAHEVNNPIAGVLVYTQLLSKKLGTDTLSKEKGLEYLSKMESELTRSSRIIRNLLDFARQTKPALRLVGLNEVVERALSLVAHTAQMQHIEVVVDLSPTLPVVMADPDQLQQVCTNLMLNAIQAMNEGGIMTLHTSVDSGDQVKVEIRDTGCGISRENMQKLFTPFFTTKKEVKGVGLGLAVSYGIIQRHQGRIEVDSEEGKGSAFTIYLNAYHEENG
ncbi:MAG: [Fe-Fe] hydrogenase large subunit C-terminal domain-containing protein [Chloroflexota bacterium]|nr:[Fe-Fe] hydrogenase large subunit C-terminal domain-containing protein [Chloroflexota bacterium]